MPPNGTSGEQAWVGDGGSTVPGKDGAVQKEVSRTNCKDSCSTEQLVGKKEQAGSLGARILAVLTGWEMLLLVLTIARKSFHSCYFASRSVPYRPTVVLLFRFVSWNCTFATERFLHQHTIHMSEAEI